MLVCFTRDMNGDFQMTFAVEEGVGVLGDPEYSVQAYQTGVEGVHGVVKKIYLEMVRVCESA